MNERPLLSKEKTIKLLSSLTRIRVFHRYSLTKFPIAHILLIGLCGACGASAKPAAPYTDPAQFTSIPFGSHSHWLQPWRAYLETVPATTFLNGTGINFNISDSMNPELVAEMLAKHGIRRARIEISWSNFDFEDETKLNNESDIRNQLLALKKFGIRPLILLNANQGLPCPVKTFTRTLREDARAGSTTVKLDDTSGLKIGYSGISNLSGFWAAEALITKINGDTVTLSKPLPKDISAGTSIAMATLKYRPFSAPGSDDYKETMAGWNKYTVTVARFVASTLGRTQSSNKGFDMEIWNELSFGSNFLFANSYYTPKVYKYEEDSIFTNLVKETAKYVENHPQDFQNVLLSDGMANTIPWPASSLQPVRINAISKHPYAGRKKYPEDEYKSKPINALYKEEEKSNFIPTYSTLFPEYFATALQTETIIRDMGPITSDIYGVKRGRNARVNNGAVVPTPIWITEVNIGPGEHNSIVTAERALAIKAKTSARYFTFFLNKGATQVYLYAVDGGDKNLGIVKDNFLEYVKQTAAEYPKDDISYVSPSLMVTSRIFAKMGEQVDRNLKSTRPLQVTSISDTHNHYQFKGDGTAVHPNLYNRDVFAFLPYQVNARRFIIPYYVMTRDVMKDLPPEQFTIKIKGIDSRNATMTAYDPLNNKNVPMVVNERGSDNLSVKLSATDYPYLLTIQEAP